MARRSNSNEGDFEIVPARSSDEFMSITTATKGEGDPYDKRADIIESKNVVANLLEKLHFKNENDIDDLHEKLKSRDALDEGIAGEITNLQDIIRNEQIASDSLRNAAEKAKGYIAKVRELACASKTTVKRALDILDIVLPVFIRACEISKENPKLSEDFVHLQDLYNKAMSEMMQHQRDFEMEQREEKLVEGKALLERSISASVIDRERVLEEISKEKDIEQLDQFFQAQSEVELMVGAESKELDVWLGSCRDDASIIEQTKQLQQKRFEEASKKYESRMKSIATNLDVNTKRQTELVKQLEILKEEEHRLKNNQIFEQEIQKRATELDASIYDELSDLQKKVNDIKEHASTAQEIIVQMQQCSSLLINTAIYTQKQKEEKLRQLEIEALTREGTALAKAAVEFKVQIQMAEDNIKEYDEQVIAIRKEIEKAAKKGQALTVSKKRQDLEEYKKEVEKENSRKLESSKKLEKMMASLESVNCKLSDFGVNMPDVDALFSQRMEDVLLGNDSLSAPMSMMSI